LRAHNHLLSPLIPSSESFSDDNGRENEYHGLSGVGDGRVRGLALPVVPRHVPVSPAFSGPVHHNPLIPPPRPVLTHEVVEAPSSDATVDGSLNKITGSESNLDWISAGGPLFDYERFIQELGMGPLASTSDCYQPTGSFLPPLDPFRHDSDSGPSFDPNEGYDHYHDGILLLSFHWY
jgi:hypothetical protein